MTEPTTPREIPESFDGSGCPFCGADDPYYSSFDGPDGGSMWQAGDCSVCNRSWNEIYYLASFEEILDDGSTGPEFPHDDELKRRQVERQLVQVAEQARELIERYDLHEYYDTEYPSPTEAKHLLSLLTSALSLAEEARVGQ